jgi:hypothetical protein
MATLRTRKVTIKELLRNIIQFFKSKSQSNWIHGVTRVQDIYGIPYYVPSTRVQYWYIKMKYQPWYNLCDTRFPHIIIISINSLRWYHYSWDR